MSYRPYIINNFRGGRSDENDRGIAGSFKGGYGGNIHSQDNTFSANQAMVNVTPSGMSDLVKYFVPATDGSTYAFGSTGSIWAISGDGAWNIAYKDYNGEIKGAEEWGIDTDGTKIVNYLFWATNSSLARVPLTSGNAIPWANATQNHKTTLDPADYHTMKNAAGALMIANNNYLASYDFNGNFDPATLNIRPGNTIKALEERDDFVILGSYRKDESEKGHLWSWVVTALNWVQKKLIPVKGVNAMGYAEFPIVQGGDDGELFTSDFASYLPLKRAGGGGQVSPSGITTYNDMIHLGFYGGTEPGIWSYGRKRSNHPYALNYEYRLSPTVAGSTVTEIGAIETVNGAIYASWATTDGSTVEYGVDQLSSTTKASAVYEGLEFDNGEPHVIRNYQLIRLLMKPMPSGTSVSAKFRINHEDDWRYGVMGDGSTTHAVSEGYSSTIAEFLVRAEALPYEVGFEVNPSSNDTPEVKAAITYVSEAGKDYA